MSSNERQGKNVKKVRSKSVSDQLQSITALSLTNNLSKEGRKKSVPSLITMVQRSQSFSDQVKADTKNYKLQLVSSQIRPRRRKKKTKSKQKRSKSKLQSTESLSCQSSISSIEYKSPSTPYFAVISLNCPVKNYEWGKKGASSCVGQMLKDQGKAVNEKLPYAELWMGTHKSGSSLISYLSPDFNEQPLTTLFQAFPEFIGNLNILSKYGRSLPFLFKILSVDKPLSIQVHPDKSLAAKLFQTRPQNYPDPNHKPEMAIALTPFIALAYFRPHSEIINCIQNISQLRKLIGESLVNEYSSSSGSSNQQNCLQKCFSALLNAPKEKAVELIQSLVEEAFKSKNPNLNLFSLIANYYPDDVGTFACFFLNCVELKPGEALFIDVNQPHCYISGNCVEIMACSDNVIRAGLTPKFKDVDLLCQCMTYEPRSKESFIVHPQKTDTYSYVYSPPVDEFAIEMVHVPEEQYKGLKYKMQSKHSASIMVVIKGSAVVNQISLIKQSGIYFLPPGVTYELSKVKGGFLAFRAYINQ